MKKEYWYRKLKQNCENAGTYKDFFIPVIDTLAQILEDRDEVRKQYIESGAKPVIDRHTERSGEINKTKNPSLLLMNDLNAQALAYWKELGLTPSGLKKLNESAINNDGKKESELEKLLREAKDEK